LRVPAFIYEFLMQIGMILVFYAPALLIQIAYPYRVCKTLIKLFSTLRSGTATQAQIFTTVRGYAGGCYLRYRGFPRRTLLESSLDKLFLAPWYRCG
jgi:hypothetical protein